MKNIVKNHVINHEFVEKDQLLKVHFQCFSRRLTCANFFLTVHKQNITKYNITVHLWFLLS